MQRKYAYFFATIMIWQLCGFIGYFEFSRHYIKKQIKHAIKRGVPEHQLTVFTFSTSELSQLSWIEGHEFRLGDRMYDVVSRKKVNEKTKLFCIHDQQEEKLFFALGESVSKKLNQSHSGKILMGWFDSMKFQMQAYTVIARFICIKKEPRYFRFSNLYRYIPVGVDVPPPKQSSFLFGQA